MKRLMLAAAVAIGTVPVLGMQAAPAQAQSCDSAYPDFCIPPPPPDLNCPDIGVVNFTALSADPHRFDADHDGTGCDDASRGRDAIVDPSKGPAQDLAARQSGGGGTTPSGYQPGACTATTNLGSIGVGQTLSGTLAPGCVYSGPVTMAVNGAGAGTKTGNPGGGVNVSLQATSQTAGLLNDPVAVAIHCGSNTITATGPTSTQGTNTATGTFTLQCAAASQAGTTSTPSSVAFTGANVLRWSLFAGLLIGLGLGAIAVARWRSAA